MVAALLLVQACSTGTSATDAIAPPSAATSSSVCVDASGPNSTPQQIVDAAMSFPTRDLTSGRTVPAEQRLAEAEGMPGQTLSAELIQLHVDQVFDDVPPGGDAAFAAAACAIENFDIRSGSFLFSGTWQASYPDSEKDREAFDSTPHILRGHGRQDCSLASGPEAFREQVDKLDGYLEQGRQDVEGFKRSVIEDMVAPISQAGDPFRAAVEATPAEILLARMEARREFIDLAIKHQCPQFAR